MFIPGCTIAPKTDPCARTATVGGGIGAAIGYNIDQRRCALFVIAREHNAEMTVSPIVLPKGDLPPAAAVASTGASTEARAISATPFMPSGDNSTAGLSVVLRDSGRQFTAGGERPSADAESLLRDVAAQYSYVRQQAKLTAASTEEDRAAVEVLKMKRILVVGHTDDIGDSGENAKLSENRAAAVARVFRQQGVPATNLFIQGAGETLPIADNHTQDGRIANRRIEIVDLPDDAALRKFLATRRQSLQFYRSIDPVLTSSIDARTNAPAQGGSTFVDFGGSPTSTLSNSLDFGVGNPGLEEGNFGASSADRPMVPSCSADRPRVARSVKSLAAQKDPPMSDYVPGLYNTSWSGTVNGHLIGLTNVDVPRDGGAATAKPTLFLWKNYNTRNKMPPADFQAQPDVNAYRGSRAILYRVFVVSPMKCIDVLFPYTGMGDARNSSLFYNRQASAYVASFELKPLSSLQSSP